MKLIIDNMKINKYEIESSKELLVHVVNLWDAWTNSKGGKNVMDVIEEYGYLFIHLHRFERRIHEEQALFFVQGETVGDDAFVQSVLSLKKRIHSEAVEFSRAEIDDEDREANMAVIKINEDFLDGQI